MKSKLVVLIGFGLLGIASAYSQNTNPPHFLSTTKSASGAPVVLQWASDPLTMYTIEYSTTLTTGNWQVAQANFPPQGTNTVWSDTGSESSFFPRFSSADPLAPYRFYRLKVERYMSNNSPITVSIDNLSGGATLSGLTDVTASGSATQGVISAKVYVDGDEAGLNAASPYTFPLETRYYPNGTHRLSVVVQDSGGLESTEEAAEANPAAGKGATFGSKSITVNFSNDLSNVRLRHKAFRPDLGQTQHIYAVWATPRLWQVDATTADDPSSVFRSFSGDGTEISISWDGTDSVGGQISPQIIGYHFYDLGPGTPAPSPGGGGGGPPAPGGQSMMAATGGEGESALFPSSAWEAMMSGLTSYFAKPPPMPPVEVKGVLLPWEDVFGPSLPIEINIQEKAQERFLQQLVGEQSGMVMAGAGQSPNAPLAGPAFSIYWPLKRLGTMGVLSQGHHPSSGSYPTPSRGPALGNVRMSSASQFGPWGPRVAPAVIAADCVIGFPTIGYEVLVRHSDDFCTPADLRKTSSGGSNTLNQVNIGLFTGHSVAGRDIELSIGYLQSYVPIYNKTANTMTFVKSSEMRFGSANLKWMAFYSCNPFRDSLYRTDGVYDQMKNNLAIPMNSQLHVLQGFATEMSVHPNMVAFWRQALSHKTGNAADYTVLGAWKYVCLMTQPSQIAANANVSRSIYWPECAGDYIYGWGPQTDPSGGSQANLQEDDQRR